MNRIRLTILATHPTQYHAPWFRHVEAHCPEIDLTVLYASRPSSRQQGAGFDQPFEWDTSLLDGYRSRFVRDAIPNASFQSESFRGVDVPEIGSAVLDTTPDVVLVPGWHSVTLLRAIFVCRRHGIPVLYRGDTHLGSAPGGWRRIAWHAKTCTFLRLYSAHLAVGRRSRDYLLRHAVPPTRIYTSPHAVDNEFLAAAAARHLTDSGRGAARAALGLGADDFGVLFVGKLVEGKRVRDAIRGMSRIGPHAALIVAGSGPDEPFARAEAERLGVRVNWLGFVNQSGLPALYAAADCLVVPSARETWGLVVNEAMATGLPVAAAESIGSAPDLIVPGETGELFVAADVDDCADALARVRDRGGRNGFAAGCRKKAAAYSFDAATTGLVAACEAVVRRPRSETVRVIACCGGMVVPTGLERMTFEVLRVVRRDHGAVHCVVNSWEHHRISAVAEQVGASWSTGLYWYGFRRTFNPIQIARSAWDIARTSGGLLRDAAAFRPTDVLLPDFGTVIWNAPALMVLRVLGVRTILRVGNAPEPQPFYRRLWRWLVVPLADRIVCNSRFTEQEVLALGAPRSKVSYVYNTAPHRPPSTSAKPPRDHGRVMYVGQVIPEKGLAVLLEAMALLVKQGMDVHLDVVGDMDGWVSPTYGRFRENVRERARRADLAGRVRFLGWREDVTEILAGAAVHCCPSQPQQREAFGVVNVEAKLAGVPSVVTPIGALPEIITHRVDGWVCRDAGAEAIAQGLAYFLEDRDRARSAGRAALASFDQFNRGRFAAAWREVFAKRAPAPLPVVSAPATTASGKRTE